MTTRDIPIWAYRTATVLLFGVLIYFAKGTLVELKTNSDQIQQLRLDVYDMRSRILVLEKIIEKKLF